MAANELEVTINLGDLTHVKGQLETMLVVVGLLAEKYPQHLIGQFISECVELKQYGELNRKRQRGLSWMDAVIGDRYGDLVDLLAGKEMDYQLQQNPELRTWKDGETMITGLVQITDKLPDETTQNGTRAALEHAEKAAGKIEAVLNAGKAETADRIRGMTRKEHADLHSAGRKNGPGIKTAERIRKATNEPVKKTAVKTPVKKAGATRKTTAKKASGAADAK